MEITYRKFCEEHDKETWNGLSCAFRNGVKCAVQGGECNYLFRDDFAQAWLRGNELATKFIEEGNVIRIKFDQKMWSLMNREIESLKKERDELKLRVEMLEDIIRKVSTDIFALSTE